MFHAETGLEREPDAELVRRIAEQDGARLAEAELCRRFAPRILLYGLRHLRQSDRFADLVQAVLLGVLEAARAGRIEEPALLARFVLGTCRHVASRIRHTEARTQPAEDHELDATAFLPAFESVDVVALMRCLTQLDTRSRTVVRLSYMDENTADEIAPLLNTSAGNVRILRHRALAQLRRCLDGSRGAS